MNQTLTERAHIPKSATNIWISIVGLLCFIASMEYVRIYQVSNFNGAVLGMLSIAFPIVILEYIFLKTHKREAVGLASTWHSVNAVRVLVKLIGLYGTFGLVSLVYWSFPEYHGSFYTPFWNLLRQFLPWVLGLSVPYFVLLDAKLQKPKEAYYHAGLLFLGQWRKVDYPLVKNHFRGWVVKLFFLPLMFIYLQGNMSTIKRNSFSSIIDNFSFGAFYDYMYNYLFTIDLVYVCVGYALTLKILDNHIRSAEPTFFGWGIALFCYQPFWSLIGGQYLKYDNNYFWGNLLNGEPFWYVVWGSSILILIGIYVWATVPFGIRFSNLTHRGIITNGPYRFMRHPAYVSKNISWWLISVPFIHQSSPTEAIRLSLLLLGVNTIYFFRARTEEKHLSQDPIYIQYAMAINAKGVFSGLFKFFPFLKYNPARYGIDVDRDNPLKSSSQKNKGL